MNQCNGKGISSVSKPFSEMSIRVNGRVSRLLYPLSFSLLSLLLSPFLYGASFDCKLANTEVEKKICANQSLSRMDEVINTLYFKALEMESLDSASGESVKEEQIEWLKNRAESCQTLYYCEKYFANRIDQLVDVPHFTQSALTNELHKGMALPDQASLDQVSASAFKYELAQEEYRPWLRKPLLTSETYRYRPRAAVVGDRLFVYFLISNKNKDKNRATLYEFSPFSGESHRITDITRYNNPYYIKDNTVYFYTETGDNERNRVITKFSYTPGSQSAAVQVGGFNKWQMLNPNANKPEVSANISSLRAPSDQILLSNNEKILAMHTQFLGSSYYKKRYRNGVGLEGEYFHEASLTADSEKLNKLDSVAIYNSETQSVEVMSDKAMGSDWFIHNIIWAQDDSSIFFDNSGSKACIWEYQLTDKKLVKIVPEHTAEQAYPFSYLGNDYIVYIVSNRVNHATKYSLMLAVRPKNNG